MAASLFFSQLVDVSFQGSHEKRNHPYKERDISDFEISQIAEIQLCLQVAENPQGNVAYWRQEHRYCPEGCLAYEIDQRQGKQKSAYP